MKINRIAFVPLIVFVIAICVVSFFVRLGQKDERENAMPEVPLRKDVEISDSKRDLEMLLKSWPLTIAKGNEKRVQFTMTTTDFPIRIELFVAESPVDWTRCVATRDLRGDKSSVRIDCALALREIARAGFYDPIKKGDDVTVGNGANTIVEWQHFQEEKEGTYLHEIRFRLAR